MGGERSCQEKAGKLATRKGTAEEGGGRSLPSYTPAHLLSPSTRVKPRGQFRAAHPPQEKENNFILMGSGSREGRGREG